MRKMDWINYREVSPPEKYSDRLKMRMDRWRSLSVGLYAMSVTGWNLVRELGETLSLRSGSLPDAKGSRRIFSEYMLEHGLALYDAELPYLGPYKLSAVRFSDFGKSVCRACGWEPVESGWERILRLHQGEVQTDHTAAILAFAREARLRDYRADILPDVNGKGTNAMPDVRVMDRQRRRAYVEVETKFHREKPEKWQNAYALQGFVAVVTRTVTQRRRLVDEIKTLGLPGKASDLETLRSNAKTTDAYFLFVERWDATGQDLPLPRNGVAGKEP